MEYTFITKDYDLKKYLFDLKEECIIKHEDNWFKEKSHTKLYPNIDEAKAKVAKPYYWILNAIDKYEDKELKTKNLAATIAKLPIERNVLLVTSQKDENLNRVASNLKNVKVITTPYLNIHDLTKYRTICFVGEDSIQLVADTFKI